MRRWQLGPVGVGLFVVLAVATRAEAAPRLVEDLRFEPASVPVALPPSAFAGGIVPSVCSAIVPGTGQLVNREPLKAIGFFVGFASTSIVGLALAQVGPGGRAGPSNWFGLGLLGAAVVLYGWSIVDAWFGGAGGGGEAIVRRAVVDEGG